MSEATDCLFCQILRGEQPARLLYEDDLVAAIDVPESTGWRRAPVHFVVVPREHLASVREVREEHGPVLARMFTTIDRVAAEQGVAESGYRIAVNTGADAGQTVFHLHLHCLGGRRLAPEGSTG